MNEDDNEIEELRDVNLTLAQFEWLQSVDLYGNAYWRVDNTDRHIWYRENKKLRIQVTKDNKTETFRVWTW